MISAGGIWIQMEPLKKARAPDILDNKSKYPGETSRRMGTWSEIRSDIEEERRVGKSVDQV